MNLKQCKYSKCRRILYLYKTSVKGCCCEEHVKLAKQEYNDNYYNYEVDLNWDYYIEFNKLSKCQDTNIVSEIINLYIQSNIKL